MLVRIIPGGKLNDLKAKNRCEKETGPISVITRLVALRIF